MPSGDPDATQDQASLAVSVTRDADDWSVSPLGVGLLALGLLLTLASGVSAWYRRSDRLAPRRVPGCPTAGTPTPGRRPARASLADAVENEAGHVPPRPANGDQDIGHWPSGSPVGESFSEAAEFYSLRQHADAVALGVDGKI